MKENLLKKEFKYKDVQRARNLIKKDYTSRTIEGVGYQKTQVEYKEGDVWEQDGKSWTIKNGIKQNISKLDSIRKSVTKPLHCPNCKTIMNYHLHEKMWKIHGICYDCVIDMEAGLRRVGKFEEYERAMMSGNLEKWAEDMTAYLLESVEESAVMVTEAGDVEDWNSNKEAQKKKVLDLIQDYTKQIAEAQKKLQTKD